MAPDKIYLFRERSKNHLEDEWHEEPADDVEVFSYIRKDTLLKWLQQGFDWIKNPVISVQQIIDKLNSM